MAKINLDKLEELLVEISERLPDLNLLDLLGMRVRDALALVDVSPIVVFWGCWTEAELDSII